MYLTDSALEATREAFLQNFESANELGASLSVWYQGEEVLNLAEGYCERDKARAWNSETLIPVYSATKGPASAVLLMVLDQHGLTPQDKVSAVWEQFPVKEATFAQMLSHQCGLAAIDEYVSVFDYDAVISAIEKQEPNWVLGDGHGYHPRTFGFLLDEICRKITGKRIAPIFKEKIADPLDIEMWIGLPEEQHQRVATLYPGKMDKSDLQSGFYRELNKEGTLVRKTFNSPRGLGAVQEMNKPEAWTAGLPAMGGVATASALAKFYQAAIGEIDFFNPNVMSWMNQPQVMGDDKILHTKTRFGCGFQLDPLDSFGQKIRNNYGPSEFAFGHPGAGGSHAFGDPDSGISFAYVMNQMELAVLPNKKSLSIIEALYS